MAFRHKFFSAVESRANSRDAALAWRANCVICSISVTEPRYLETASLANPNERSNGQALEQRDQVRRGQMNAAMRRGTAQRFFIAESVNVNEARERIDVSPRVVPRFEPLQP